MKEVGSCFVKSTPLISHCYRRVELSSTVHSSLNVYHWLVGRSPLNVPSQPTKFHSSSLYVES